jgi:murein DD-endopeptidase MepM/ murein hydrolase activator NlpD
VARDLRRPPRRAKASSKVGSLVALLFAGALLVGMSVPANAFMGIASPLASTTSVADPGAAQGVDVSASAAPSTVSRDGFSVVSYKDLMVQAYGIRTGTFTPTIGAIRWPFPYSVPISDGWGPRVAPCDGCSTFHQGVDFTPGTGTPIYAIADGVVEEHSGDSGFDSFGNHVIIRHNIPGQNIESLYAHMITGSSILQVGDAIKVGDFIGLVGDTGSSVGAHLHFEIHIDKVPVDPFAWLEANTTNVP